MAKAPPNAYQAASKKEKAAIQAYLKERRALVCDESGPCRTSVTKGLLTMGMPHKQILSSPAFDQALEELQENQTEIVICDYRVGHRSGLELASA